MSLPEAKYNLGFILSLGSGAITTSLLCKKFPSIMEGTLPPASFIAIFLMFGTFGIYSKVLDILGHPLPNLTQQIICAPHYNLGQLFNQH